MRGRRKSDRRAKKRTEKHAEAAIWGNVYASVLVSENEQGVVPDSAAEADRAVKLWRDRWERVL